MTVEIQSHRLRSWDGTELAWYEGGRPEAPPMVLCPGLGGGVRIWRALFERFADRFRLLSWDYRGLYRSRRAPHDGAYDLIHHVRDLVALLDHTGARDPVLVGWSMGVQVALELHRDHAGRAAAMVAIHGTAGRPLDSAFDSSVPRSIAPWAFGLMRALGPRFGWVGPSLARNPVVVRSFVELAQRLGYMGAELRVPEFRDIAEEWAVLDLDAYARTFEALAQHDAGDLLPGIGTPTLVIAGEVDRFTPLSLSERMVEQMPDARLEVIPGATHFGLIERPKPIADAVERFVSAFGLSREAEEPPRRRRKRKVRIA